MTLNNVCNQLVSMAMAGRINGEKFNDYTLANYLEHWFAPDRVRPDNKWFMTISLPDGEWMFYVYRYNNTPDGYDYYIPDTREQEAKLKAML